MTKVVILCGGLGTRLKEQTAVIPKPMIQIGEQPLIWHIMKIYSHFGFNEFVLPVGYKSEVIRDFFANYKIRNSDFTINLASNEITLLKPNLKEDWTVHLIDTGVHSLTTRRVELIKEQLKDNDFFLLTYGDGVADIDINKLIEFHKSKGKLATITGYEPSSRFGIVNEKDGIVTDFVEKPQTQNLINAGFMVFQKEALKYFNANTPIERDVLVRLAQDNELAIYKHESFWYAVDNQREFEELNKMWKENPKWKVWKD